jgi:hypothetical protein
MTTSENLLVIEAIKMSIQLLGSQRDEAEQKVRMLELKVKLLEGRETFCSDCFDKVAHRGCWRCKCQVLENGLHRIINVAEIGNWASVIANQTLKRANNYD